MSSSLNDVPAELVDRVFAAVDRRREEIVQFAGELIRQPSVNPDLEVNPDAEGPAQRWLADQLREMGGFEVDCWEVEANRPNVVASRTGRGGGRSLIWSAHTDVVPVTPEQAEQWEGAGPFSGEVRDGKLWGEARAT